MSDSVYRNRIHSRLQQTVAMLTDSELASLFLHSSVDECRVLVSILPIRVLSRVAYELPSGFIDALPCGALDDSVAVKAISALIERINLMCENNGKLPPEEADGHSLSIRILDFIASRFGRISIKS